MVYTLACSMISTSALSVFSPGESIYGDVRIHKRMDDSDVDTLKRAHEIVDACDGVVRTIGDIALAHGMNIEWVFEIVVGRAFALEHIIRKGLLVDDGEGGWKKANPYELYEVEEVEEDNETYHCLQSPNPKKKQRHADQNEHEVSPLSPSPDSVAPVRVTPETALAPTVLYPAADGLALCDFVADTQFP